MSTPYINDIEKLNSNFDFLLKDCISTQMIFQSDDMLHQKTKKPD